MILTLFVVFLSLSLIFVALGLFKSEHSELGIIGFTFIFLLSLNLLYGTIEIKTGVNETYTYACLCCSQGLPTSSPGICTENSTNLVVSKIELIDNYASYDMGGILAHTVGYLMAISSIIGFIAVLLGLGKDKLKGEGIF